MTANQKFNELAIMQAHAEAADYIETIAKRMEQYAESLRQYGTRFQEACNGKDKSSSPVTVFGWTVNEMENLTRNLNFSQAARISSNLTIAQNLK
jgi:hypothetical protein